MAIGNFATRSPKQAIFRFNPGIKEEIFPDKHPYYKASNEVVQVIDNQGLKKAKEETKLTLRDIVLNDVSEQNYQVRFTKTSLKLYTGEARTIDELALLTDIALIGKELIYIGRGELDTKSKTSKNIEKKIKRGVKEYVYFISSYNGEDYKLSFERFERRGKSHLEPYGISKIRK